MASISTAQKEFLRILKLSEYDLDYTGKNPLLNDLSRLAAFVADMPISQINLVGPNTQWTLSSFGMDVQQMSRNESICQFTVLESDFFEASNLDQNKIFKDRDFVKGDLALRYYFGVPIKTSDGHNIGTVCVMDKKVNPLSPIKIELITTIAKNVVHILDQNKSMRELEIEIEEMDKSTKKLSHDVRGPITGIIGLSQIAKEQIENENYDDLENINDMILKGGHSVIDLADEILSVHKTHELPHLEHINLITLKDKIESLYEPQAFSKGITFSVSCDAEHSIILFSRQNLLQIIGNLLSNAFKFTKSAGAVHLSLNLKLISKKTILCIKVKDSGIGMLESQVKRLNDLGGFSTQGTNNERGFGFGFQLAKKLIESMDGKLEVNSIKGEGTTILVQLVVAS
ncbi:MAG: HAMP domain-containing sensor histidine kinase [Balneolaceae bacterium]